MGEVGVETLDPCIARCVKLGVANYTATARLLQQSLERLGDGVSTAALKMRLIRWRSRAPDHCYGLTCERLARLLAETRIELREGVTVITVPKAVFQRIEGLIPRLMVEARLFNILQGVSGVTIIVDEEHAEALRRAAGEALEELRGQAALILVSPREILETPGFIAYISTLLAVNGINITQVVSCYTDTIILVSERDAPRAYRVLLDAVEAARRLSAPEIKRSSPEGHPGSPLITRD